MAHPCAFIPCIAAGPVRALRTLSPGFSPAAIADSGPYPIRHRRMCVWCGRPNGRTVPQKGRQSPCYATRVFGITSPRGVQSRLRRTPCGWRCLSRVARFPGELCSLAVPLSSRPHARSSTVKTRRLLRPSTGAPPVRRYNYVNGFPGFRARSPLFSTVSGRFPA